MSVDLQNLAQFSVKQVQKIANQAATTPLIKLEMPNDSFGGKILDLDGIQAIMKKFDLIIAQAKEHLEEATRKYNSTATITEKGKSSSSLCY